MPKRDELNERALLAVELRRKKMSVPDIARYLSTCERQVFRYFKRAQQLYRLLARTSDCERHLGETLTVFYERERDALAKFVMVNSESPVAVAYLNAARDARKEIEKLLQEAGMITKVPEQLDVNPGFNVANEKVRTALYQFLKIAKAEGEKILGLP